VGSPVTAPRRTVRRATVSSRRDRLAALGAPDDLITVLLAMDVGLPMAERLAQAGIPWSLVQTLVATPGLGQADDFSGLLVLWDEQSEQEILTWARIGSLDAAYRLDALGVSPALAMVFPRDPDRSLHDLVRMVQEARKHGVRVADLLLWHTGGVLRASAPYIDENRFAQWRAVATQSIGMRRAAVACAAGLTPREAADRVRGGLFDENGLRMLAALRT
jgi:hypothetical protein